MSSIPTPALVIDADVLDGNLATMAAACPGSRLRPHVKAHKCTTLAAAQAAVGHRTFTCATPREVIGMAAAGLGDDLLLANETVDPVRLAAMAALDGTAMVTVAVDSEATIDAAAAAGIRHVLIDLMVGLPRCGCDPHDAGRLADLARAKGLNVRGVMGYEGHLMAVQDRAERAEKLVSCVDALLLGASLVGGDIVSTGGTGTFDLHDERVNEIQAGSYVLMDTQYGRSGVPFRQGLFIESTVISVTPPRAAGGGWVVCDAGLKSQGMDHGNPSLPGATVWFCSDEHTVFSMDGDAPQPKVGDRVRLVPAHIDPTIAYHDRLYVRRGDDLLDVWPVDLRGW
jgi:D-serine deaminase-like pyridoxal phosphate-dependent protein